MEVAESSNKRKLSKTSVACAACKSRKSKCSGGPPPCTACAKQKTACVIHPGSDMRRKDSKDHFKAYKALLDAFVTATRSGDVLLSRSLFGAIQRTDRSGILAQVADSFAQAIESNSAGETRNPLSDLDYKFGDVRIPLPRTIPLPSHVEELSDILPLPSSARASPTISDDAEIDVLSNSPRSPTFSPLYHDAGCQTEQIYGWSQVRSPNVLPYRTESLSPEDRPVGDFEELLAFWSTLPVTHSSGETFDPGSSLFACDPKLLQAEDPMSKAIMDFRDGARRAIRSGTPIEEIIGPPTPALDTFFALDARTPVHSAWNWACQFARAFPDMSRALQLATIYITGIQMRFLVYPCSRTFDQLPPMLRPLRKQYTVEHPAGVDICQFPVLKDFLLDNWAAYDSLSLRLISGQSCNWPYSDQACLAPLMDISMTYSMSQAFLEHICNLDNFTLSSDIVQMLTQRSSQPSTSI